MCAAGVALSAFACGGRAHAAIEVVDRFGNFTISVSTPPGPQPSTSTGSPGSTRTGQYTFATTGLNDFATTIPTASSTRTGTGANTGESATGTANGSLASTLEGVVGSGFTGHESSFSASASVAQVGTPFVANASASFRQVITFDLTQSTRLSLSLIAEGALGAVSFASLTGPGTEIRVDGVPEIARGVVNRLGLPAGQYTLETRGQFAVNSLSPFTSTSFASGATLEVLPGAVDAPSYYFIEDGEGQLNYVDAEIVGVTNFAAHAVDFFEDLALDDLIAQTAPITLPTAKALVSALGAVSGFDITYNGAFDGNVNLNVGVDPATLPGGILITDLVILHYSDAGEWELLETTVDPVTGVLSAVTDDLSPFIIGVTIPEPGAAAALLALLPAVLRRRARRWLAGRSFASRRRPLDGATRWPWITAAPRRPPRRPCGRSPRWSPRRRWLRSRCRPPS